MFKLCVVAIVLAVAAMSSVDAAVPVYRYLPTVYPYYGLGGVIPAIRTVESKAEKEAEEKVEERIGSYLIDPLYSGFYNSYGTYPYGTALRLIRDADKQIEESEVKVDEVKKSE